MRYLLTTGNSKFKGNQMNYQIIYETNPKSEDIQILNDGITEQANLKSRRVMEKIGLHHSEADDFNHPKLEEDSPLKRHVLYRITRDNYQANQIAKRRKL